MVSYPPTRQSELFDAARKGDLQCVNSLLRVGGPGTASAAIDAATGWSALAAALINGHGRVAEALLAAGASVAHVDHRGNSPMHALAAGACADDNDEIGLVVARTMLNAARLLGPSRGLAVIGAPNHEGATPLHLAAQKGKCSLIEAFGEHGAPLSALDREGRDPYYFRADARTEKVLLRLLADSTLRYPEAGALSGRSVSSAWNLSDPGPRHATDPVKQLLKPPPPPAAPSARRAGSLVPPHPVAAPPAPPLPAGGIVGRAKAARAAPGPKTRTGRKLTKDEERKATYLSRYLAPAEEKMAPASLPMTIEEKIAAAFKRADVSGSGTVGKRELYRALTEAGLAAAASAEGLRLFQLADADLDGQLTLDEFGQLAKQLKQLLAEPAPGAPVPPRPPASLPHAAHTLSSRTRALIVKAFAKFDADHSGWISLSELSGALRACGMYVDDAKLRSMFNEADIDRSGGIDQADFELLVQRLMAPPRVLGTDSFYVPPPASGSAVAAVFSAFEKGSTGFMTSDNLPQALRLLSIDPEEPPVKKLCTATTDGRGGVLDRHSFTMLVYRLLRCEYDVVPSGTAEPSAADPLAAALKEKPDSALKYREGVKYFSGEPVETGGKAAKASKEAAAKASKEAVGKAAKTSKPTSKPTSTLTSPVKGKETSPRGKAMIPTKPTTSAGAPSAASGASADEVLEKLARAFVTSPSESNGTVAMREVPSILLEAGFASAAERSLFLAAAASPMDRVRFNEVVSLALDEGSGVNRDGASSTSPGRSPTARDGARDGANSHAPPLQLRVVDMVLSSSVVGRPELNALCLLMHASLEAHDGRAAPLVMRSPLLPKQLTPMRIDLEVRLPPSVCTLQLELLYEAAPDQLAPFAACSLDLDEIRSALAFPLACTVPLRDSAGRQAAALEILVERVHGVPPSQPALSPKKLPNGGGGGGYSAAFNAAVEEHFNAWSTSLYASNSFLHEIGATARQEQRERIREALEVEWRAAGLPVFEGEGRGAGSAKDKSLEELEDELRALRAERAELQQPPSSSGPTLADRQSMQEWRVRVAGGPVTGLQKPRQSSSWRAWGTEALDRTARLLSSSNNPLSQVLRESQAELARLERRYAPNSPP
jgi:Ca2+-binding EF-hand superfamily protein